LVVGTDGETFFDLHRVKQELYGVQAMAADTTHLYVLANEATDLGTGWLLRVRLNDGNIDVLSETTLAGRLLLEATQVYWTDDMSVQRISKDGSHHEVFAAQQSFCAGIASVEGEIYWSNLGGVQDAIYRKTTIAEAPVAFLPGRYGASILLADADAIYFATLGDAARVARVARAGGAPTVLLPGKGEGGDLAGDDAFVYWGGTKEVVSIRKSDGATTTIASGQNRPAGLAVDEHAVYWVNTGGQPILPNAISPGVYSIAKAGGPVVALASPEAGARLGRALALTPSHVYWTEEARIRHAAK